VWRILRAGNVVESLLEDVLELEVVLERRLGSVTWWIMSSRRWNWCLTFLTSFAGSSLALEGDDEGDEDNESDDAFDSLGLVMVESVKE
jgi:hypothetical protein